MPMTETEWVEKMESLEQRYPELDVREAFSRVADAYIEQRPVNYAVQLSDEFVAEAVVLLRYALNHESSKPVEKPTITPTATAAVMMEDTTKAELEKRAGCMPFGRKR